MSKSFLFFLFPAVFLVSSAFPTAETTENETVDDDWKAFSVSFDTERCRKAKNKFFECARKFSNITFDSYTDTEIQENAEILAPYLGNISDCMGDTTCGPLTLGIYVTRSRNFQKECISTASECIKSSNIALIRDYCASTINQTFEPGSWLETYPARCVAVLLKDTVCDKNDKTMVFRAELARMDLEKVMKTLEDSVGQPDLTNLLFFNLNFEPFLEEL